LHGRKIEKLSGQIRLSTPWVGCTKVRHRRGCPQPATFCYAEKWAKRSGQVEWGNHPRHRTTETYWRNPLTWNAQARLFQTANKRRQRVFCASLADVFDNQVDPEWRSDYSTSFAFATIRLAALTKRPQTSDGCSPRIGGMDTRTSGLGQPQKTLTLTGGVFLIFSTCPATVTFR